MILHRHADACCIGRPSWEPRQIHRCRNFLDLFGFLRLPVHCQLRCRWRQRQRGAGPPCLPRGRNADRHLRSGFLAATTIKRLHDRDKSGWWIVPFLVAPALLRQFADRLDDSNAVVAVFSLAAFVFRSGALSSCYFLKGTSGPNRFGPDPLAPAHARPACCPALGSGERARICPAQCWPIAGASC